MRFFQVKKESLKCHGCEGQMGRGEIAVWFALNMRKEGIVAGRFNFIFHPQCFRDWNDRIFLKRYEEYKTSLVPRKKRGRPKEHEDGKTIHRLKALQAYHRKAGNMSRVEELETELTRRKVRC